MNLRGLLHKCHSEQKCRPEQSEGPLDPSAAPQNDKASLRMTNGFSLFEVMIAMAIMSSAAVLMYVAWSGNHVRVRKMAINNKAAFLLDQIISELEIKYSERLLQLPETEGGTFDDHPKYSWTMVSKDFEMPDLRSILISGDDGDEMTLLIVDKLTEYLNESVKEMKVTIQYSIDKKRTIKYSATTFLVDYNKPIPLGGVGLGAGGGGGN